MDPALSELLRTQSRNQEVEAILRLTDPAARIPGVRIVSRFGDIVTCRLPLDRIVETRERDEVASLKAARLLGPESPVISDSDLRTRPSDIRRPPGLRYAGRGSVVCFLDWGFAFTAASLRHADGRTRLLALWDQRRSNPRRPNRYGYGTIHDAAHLNAALATGDPYRAIDYHPANSDPLRLGAHGTHTACIGVGNGRNQGPIGIAPEADIVCVHLGTEAIGANPLLNLGDSVRAIEAIDLCRRVANGRPFVISASIGRHGGPHDGSTLLEKSADFISQDPNALSVHSGGNYYAKNCHASGTLRRGDTRTLRLIVDPKDRSRNEVEAWYELGTELSIRIETPNGDQSRWVPLGQRAELAANGRIVGRIYHRERDPQNDANLVDIFLEPGQPAGEWHLILRADKTPGAGSVFHAWVERDDGCGECQARFHPDDADSSVTTSTLANATRTISVGAVNAHDPSRPIAHFSSAGPTRDGRMKPDCVAPGVGVLAARSPWFGESDSNALTRRSGTSMAAPHVSGCAALLLEAGRGRFGEGELREIILSTVDPPGAGADSNRYGHGHLNVQRAVAAAERVARRRETPAGRSFVHLGSLETHTMANQQDFASRLLDLVSQLIGRGGNITGDELLRAALDQAAGSSSFPPARKLYRGMRAGGRASDPTFPNDRLQVVARPLERFAESIAPGDIIMRRALGEGGLTHVAIVAGPELTRAELAAAGLTPEDDATGSYVHVIEGGFRPHNLNDRFARRVRDSSMRGTADQIVLRLSPLGSPVYESIDAFSETECEGCFHAMDDPEAAEDALSRDVEDESKKLEPALSAAQLRKIEETAQWLEVELVKLEEQRLLSTAERVEALEQTQVHLEEARKLARPRNKVDPITRARVQRLVDGVAAIRGYPEQMRKYTEAQRALAGRRLFSHFKIDPPTIRIEEHEACRINFGFTTLPLTMAAFIVEETAEGGGFRQLAYASPRDRYQTAIWEGLFGRTANRPPETGTYRIHVTAKDALGMEEMSDLIRVENPNNKTVVPRAESESGEKIRSLKFDGASLTLEDTRGKQITVRAISGKKPNNPLNMEGRDYTRPACQWAKDRGPIPAGKYLVRKNVAVQEPTLVRTTPDGPEVLQYPSSAPASVWGPMRALLSPDEVCGRKEFFIHLDVKDDGTAGCIGVHRDEVGKFNLMMKILKRATEDVLVEVAYPPDTSGCYGLPTECEEGRSGDAAGYSDFFTEATGLLPSDAEPLRQQCAFFGSTVLVTEADLRDAVRAAAETERDEWRVGGNAASEDDASQFGKLVQYWLCRTGNIRPSTLTALKALTVDPAVNYGLLLDPAATVAQIDAEVARVRAALLSAVAGPPIAGLNQLVESALRDARTSGVITPAISREAWSAVFVVACIRSAGIGLGLETEDSGTHVGRNGLLLAHPGHRGYVIEADRRAKAGVEGTYHAFPASERSLRVGDIVILDRQAGTLAAVWRFENIAGLAGGRRMHGDIVISVDPAAGFAICIGGNVGQSVRRRRYPLGANGRLIVDRTQLYTRESGAGNLPPVPAVNLAAGLNDSSTGRIFAVLSPVHDCAVIPGQPIGSGMLA